jgi:hypothetical protein
VARAVPGWWDDGDQPLRRMGIPGASCRCGRKALLVALRCRSSV